MNILDEGGGGGGGGGGVNYQDFLFWKLNNPLIYTNELLSFIWNLLAIQLE